MGRARVPRAPRDRILQRSPREPRPPPLGGSMHVPVRAALATATLALFASIARACPNDAPKELCGPASIAPAPVQAPAARVAWKPRAWRPAGLSLLAHGLWVSRDPIDGALGMPPSRLVPSAVGPGGAIPDNTPPPIDH